jgi:hypothetical protein
MSKFKGTNNKLTSHMTIPLIVTLEHKKSQWKCITPTFYLSKTVHNSGLGTTISHSNSLLEAHWL